MHAKFQAARSTKCPEINAWSIALGEIARPGVGRLA